jgi:hypothetical protein
MRNPKMAKKVKADPAQASLPAKAFGPGPAAQPKTVDPPKRQLPSKADVEAMGARFKVYTQTLRDMLGDVQTMASEGWPIGDVDHEQNLAQQIVLMLEVRDHETEGAKTVELDTTLATLIGDVDAIADDLAGPDMGEWVRAIVSPSKPAEPARVAGTPSRGKATK